MLFRSTSDARAENAGSPKAKAKSFIGDSPIYRSTAASNLLLSSKAGKPDKYQDAKEAIKSIYHEKKGIYGYGRITAERHNRNILINHKTVQRLMKELELVCRVRMKKYRSYKGEVGKTALKSTK